MKSQNKFGAFLSRARDLYQNNRAVAILRRYSPALLVVLILAAFFYVIPVEELVAIFSRAIPWYLIGGVLVMAPFLFFDAMQLRILLVKQGIDTSVLEILRTNLTIRFYQLFAPGSVVGGGIRVYGFAKLTNRPVPIVAVLTYNRLYNIVLTIVSAVIFWLLSASDDLEKNLPLFVVAIAAGVAALLALPFFSRFVAARLAGYLSGSRGPFVEWVLRNLHKLLDALSSFSGLTLKDQAGMVFYSVAGQLTALISYYWLALSIGINLSLADMGWIRSVILFSLYLPINPSIGITVREVGFAAILVAIGVDVELAGAYALLILARTNLVALTGGLIELVRTFVKRAAAGKGHA